MFPHGDTVRGDRPTIALLLEVGMDGLEFLVGADENNGRYKVTNVAAE